ncbi:hypothetical protein KHC23_22005 [Ancylobacter dichloromethanicus]|uniref:Uncharacterized protein n=1 Tax=Ancylobacter dichloromethanicus TaxID=518825 RepID=A0A9W6J685_9HYPH|nr:hypothetical protein [Ancylobacter dichloromethanicus]MBS7556310.1 hypothetical protein [Ancylobacter dichloromethanicus]GLK70073.1 hypothetical protein GCM10017643_01880 [Ancylobacter dichloromethanicus]
MTFSPAEALLFVALVVTSGCVVMMYRKLKQFSHVGLTYRLALHDSAAALAEARDAVALLNDDSRALLADLSVKIHQAEDLVGRLERAGVPRSR